MKKIHIFLALLALLAIGCTRIEGGYEGILIKQFGDNRGVQNATIVTGKVIYNPFTEDVLEYPTFFQHCDYAAFSVDSKDGSRFVIDPVVDIRMIPGNGPKVYTTYHKPIDGLFNGILLTLVKGAFKDVLNNYTADSILSSRASIDAAVTKRLDSLLQREGFEQTALTYGMSPPAVLSDAINDKNAAMQRAKQAENDQIRATNLMKSKIINAQADSAANRILAGSVNAMVLKAKELENQRAMIDKWNGTGTIYYGLNPALTKNVE